MTGKEPMSDAERDKALASRPSPNHVTLDDIKAKIVDASYYLHGTLIVAIVTLQNGYTVTGKSACADPANFDLDLGKKLAFDDAVRAVWPLEGYLLRERLYRESQE